MPGAQTKSVKETRIFIELDGLLPAEKYGTLAAFAKECPREFFVDDRANMPKIDKIALGKLITELCAHRGLRSMYRWPTA